MTLRQSLANMTKNTYLNWGGSSLLPFVSTITQDSPALELAGSTADGVGCIGTPAEHGAGEGSSSLSAPCWSKPSRWWLWGSVMVTCLFVGNCSWREWLLCLLLPHVSNCKAQPTDPSRGVSSETTLWSVAGLTWTQTHTILEPRELRNQSNDVCFGLYSFVLLKLRVRLNSVFCCPLAGLMGLVLGFPQTCQGCILTRH